MPYDASELEGSAADLQLSTLPACMGTSSTLTPRRGSLPVPPVATSRAGDEKYTENPEADNLADGDELRPDACTACIDVESGQIPPQGLTTAFASDTTNLLDFGLQHCNVELQSSAWGGTSVCSPTRSVHDASDACIEPPRAAAPVDACTAHASAHACGDRARDSGDGTPPSGFKSLHSQQCEQQAAEAVDADVAVRSMHGGPTAGNHTQSCHQGGSSSSFEGTSAQEVGNSSGVSSHLSESPSEHSTRSVRSRGRSSSRGLGAPRTGMHGASGSESESSGSIQAPILHPVHAAVPLSPIHEESTMKIAVMHLQVRDAFCRTSNHCSGT